EIERAKLFEKGLFTAVDAMDNNALSAVYQGLISKQTDGFKKELARIINHPDADPATKALAEKAFADLSRVEAMVVSEISRRMILDKTPDDQKANVPSLMERYAGAGAPAANHYAGDRDMSTVNLAIMAGAAAKGSNDSKTANAKTDATLSSHGMGAVDSKKIGDMLRSQELTVNMKFAALMGYRRNGEKAPSLFKRPNAHLVNTFESKEEQGLDLLGSGLLKHRDAVEKCFFPEYGEKPIQGKDRPVYGALNTIKMTSGAADTHGGIYGRVVVVMRQHVKQNCTYTLDDSFWATRLSLPEAKRAEMEEMLVAAFASRLKDPAAALAELRTPGSGANKAVTYFYTQRGAATTNLSAHNIDTLVNQMVQFLKKHLKDGEREVEDSEIYAHFTEQHALKTETQSKIAGYDNIENLLAQECDFTALSMGIATLRQQENPKSPAAFEGCAYIEAQFHGPVLLDRDVEEIRIDTFEIKEHFEHMFAMLPKEQRDALDEDAWIQARFDEAVAEIKEDTKNAPFKVVFYDSEKTFEAEGDRVYKASKSQNKEAVSLLKDDLVALGEAFKGERFAEVADRVARNLSGSRKDYVTALVGERLEKIPDWLMEAIRQMMDKVIATFGTDVNVFNENKIFDTFVRCIGDLLAQLDTSLMAMDPAGRNKPEVINELRDLGFGGRDLTVADPQARIAILKEIARSPEMSPTQALAYVEIHLAGEKALADVNAFVRETFEKGIDGGADLVKWAFGDLPPVSGAAERAVAQRIQNEIRAIKADISGDKLRTGEMKQGKLVERLRKRAVQPFIEPKARILAAQVHMAFPSEAERNAFLAWATSAGKIKTEAEFVGVYEGSTLLADTLAAKLAVGAPLSAQDLVDGFKAFIPTAFDYMLEDAQDRAEYGPDDRQNFVGRIVSVALSRLAERVGREGLAKIAAALDTPDARWLHTALAVGDPDGKVAEDLIRQGTFETAAAFFEILHQRLAAKFDL
ncbi:MAG: DUF3626 domain-containing protein, partial [Kiritimatiellae bacterium]|nr:DUF3626 domain-containing protein [Kiritimatiellia bacterium]